MLSFLLFRTQNDKKNYKYQIIRRKKDYTFVKKDCKDEKTILFVKKETNDLFFKLETWNKEKQQSETGCCTCSIS